ncbi:S24 family peptidase [Hahella sp. HN01]|uniref:S24 family peptidase n=1 Tax=Hahella sp. HN01 TaxID=2847262 RepID=UPI001C1EFA42|nr:S24 family peptidase [Hahella sp. HN01]MBU6956070.1 helix-turn-helix domain-containing protein [Hahella sp. HN01]
MDTSNRIKQRMQAVGLKAVQISKLMGVSRGTVSQWVNGVSKPSGQNLIALSQALECDPDWLLSGKERQKPESNATWMGKVEVWEEGDPLKEDEIELPFYTEVKLSNGNGSVVKIDNNGAKLRFSVPLLEHMGADSKSAACLTVNGPSMEPVLPDGSTAIIDAGETSIRDGKLYGIDHNGMLIVRLVFRVPGGGLRLKCYNSSDYPDEIIVGENLKNVRVLGRIIWYSVALV